MIKIALLGLAFLPIYNLTTPDLSGLYLQKIFNKKVESEIKAIQETLKVIRETAILVRSASKKMFDAQLPIYLELIIEHKEKLIDLSENTLITDDLNNKLKSMYTQNEKLEDELNEIHQMWDSEKYKKQIEAIMYSETREILKKST